MHPPEVNIDLAEAMVDEFEAYLLSNELFWPIGRPPLPGNPPFPRLALGGLLLTLDELAAQEGALSPRLFGRYGHLRLQFDALFTKWASACEAKAGRELASRVNLWQAYLDELEEAPRWAEDYPHEVRQRVMASRLGTMARLHPDVAPQLQRLRELDARLRRAFRRGQFVWDEALRAVYSEEYFWFLYGTPGT
jgi:hypothetical protein